MSDPTYWGTRTDFLSGSHIDWRRKFYNAHGEYPPFWLFDKHEAWKALKESPGHFKARRHLFTDDVFYADTHRWMEYFKQFSPEKPKPSNGLMALFCAAEQGYTEVGVIGFDSFFTDSPHTGKWFADQSKSRWVHDQRAEQAAMKGLGIEVINLGDISRQRPDNRS